MPVEAQKIVLLDSIFKALDVNSIEDIDLLLSFFVTDDALIASHEAMAAIKQYTGSKKLDLVTTSEVPSELEVGGSQKQKLLKDYWSRMETILDEKSSRTWNVSKSLLTP
jgi:hypothetical protein